MAGAMPQASDISAIGSEREQKEVTDFLSRPGILGDEQPESRTTHISRLFFTETRAFKLKRALTLPFLDFAPPEKRRAAAEREISLNRRTAPDIYLGVRTVTREADGSLALDGAGPAIDWLVEMRRFDDSQLCDRLARDGRFDAGMARELADLLIDFHGRIENRPDKGGHKAMATSIQDLAAALIQSGEPVLGQFAEELGPPLLRACSNQRQMLEDRRMAGMVRQCHGDMHLGNLCVIDGAVTAFDCIEFNDDIACVDVLYDLAFPAMDLVHFGLRPEAQALLNRYLAATRDYDGLALMPLFLAGRALVRTMAEGLAGNVEAARAYATLSDQLRRPPRPRLVAVGGLSGTGKSSVAYRLALDLADGPGAAVVRSDEIRKRMFGRAPEDRLQPAAYASDISRRMYTRMTADASRALAAGWPVIADATFMAPADREAVETTARDASMAFTGLWLEAPTDVLRERVTGRIGDASDADVAVLERQLQVDVGEVGWTRIDASGTIEATAAAAARAL